MNTGDVKAGRVSSEEWLTTPSTDPNAALWASITPPPSPNLATLIRRRLSALSLDLLAQRLYSGFPHHFSSPLAASRALLAGVAALGAGVGLAAYLVAGAFLGSDAESASAEAAPARTATEMSTARAGVTTDVDVAARHAEPEAGSTARAEASVLSDAPAQALANTAALEPERLVQALQPGAGEERQKLASSKTKKRAHARKKVKARAKPRARAAASLGVEAEAEAAVPERTAAPRARPRRQAAVKFN
jgi:hypothetical protein